MFQFFAQGGEQLLEFLCHQPVKWLDRGRLSVNSGLSGFADGVVFLQVAAQGEHRCGVNLADA
jgi:hypothetical protein